MFVLVHSLFLSTVSDNAFTQAAAKLIRKKLDQNGESPVKKVKLTHSPEEDH